MAFEQRPESGEGTSHVNTWGRTFRQRTQQVQRSCGGEAQRQHDSNDSFSKLSTEGMVVDEAEKQVSQAKTRF